MSIRNSIKPSHSAQMETSTVTDSEWHNQLENLQSERFITAGTNPQKVQQSAAILKL